MVRQGRLLGEGSCAHGVCARDPGLDTGRLHPGRRLDDPGHGRAVGFLTALGSVVVWAALGPVFQYSENWQLVINTGTTIVTFLMVFLIQNAQNRESKAIHLKLDELIFAFRKARNEMIDIEHLTDEQLDRLAQQFKRVAECNHHKLVECIAPEAEPGPKPKPPGVFPATAGPHMTVK
jgi:low affinity Fe/Cu permease